MAIFLNECRDFNMTQSQYGCLRALHELPGVDQIALGPFVGLDRSTAGMVIKTLSGRGLIERVVNVRDKRRMLLKLSADGEKLLVEIAPAAAQAQERVLTALPRKSRASFIEVLEQFLAGNGAQIDVNLVLAAVPPPDTGEVTPKSSSSARHAVGGRTRRRKTLT